jgi:hypothetical protein
MRLSDLLRALVLDAEGARVGHVHDIRFVRDGPEQGAFGPAYRLQGLIVGAGSIGNRLGFDRADVKGPYPLKAFFRWFHGDAKFVEWQRIAEIGEGTITLNVPQKDLREVPVLRE